MICVCDVWGTPTDQFAQRRSCCFYAVVVLLVIVCLSEDVQVSKTFLYESCL